MTLFEVLSIGVALLASSVAVISLISTLKDRSRIEGLEAEQIALQREQAELTRRQVKLQEELASYELDARRAEKHERERADIRLRIVDSGNRLLIENMGGAPATDVDVRVLCHDRVTSALARGETEDNLPLKKLRSREEFMLPLGLSHDCYPPLAATARWTDPDGSRQSHAFTLSY